jgi:uncharacterized protein (DUF58 family)
VLTHQGWGLLAAAILMIVSGRLLGVLELFVLGTAAALLVAVVVTRSALTRLDIAVRRDVHPPRVHAGSPSRIELEVVNRGTRTTPVLRITDAVSGTRGADLGLAPIGPGGRARAAYRLPTDRRGIVAIGPLDVVLADPFGLTSVGVRGAERTELTVYPRIDHVAGLPETTGHDPEATNESPSSLGRAGEEFFAIRPYQIGDELRRVHWPSTARFDELLVRQTELPWQGRATVLLDLRAEAQTEASLDLCVSAVASIITAARRDGDLFRLVCTDGTDSGFVPGNAAYSAVLEYLATVPVSRASQMNRILDSVARTSHGGALVVVSASLAQHDRARVEALRSRFTTLTTVVVDRSAWDPRAPADAVPAPTSHEIHVTREQPFPTAWNQAMSRSRRRAGTRPAASNWGTTGVLT